MLEQIAQLVKQYGEGAVVNNPEVPSNLNNQVMAEATKTVTSGFQNILSGGGLESILSMFTGQQRSNTGLSGNPIVAMMVGHLANKLVGKMNLSPAIANAVANNIIPGVINGLVNNTRSNDPSNDSFDLNDLIASLSGGNSANDNRQTNGFDFQDLLEQFTGGDGQGQMPSLDNVLNTVTQRAQQNQQNQGGGLGELIGSFFR